MSSGLLNNEGNVKSRRCDIFATVPPSGRLPHDFAHVTFSHVMVRVLTVPVSGSGDGGVDR